MKSFENSEQPSEQESDGPIIDPSESPPHARADVLNNEIATEKTTDLSEVGDRELGLDLRQQETIRTGRYFDLYKDELRELFVALGRENEWSDNPREMLTYMRAKWIGGEHGNAAEKDQFSDEQIEAAIPILNKLGLLNELRPPDGSEYDEIVVVGGTMTANYKRMKFLLDMMQNHGITAKKVSMLLGQRPRGNRDGTDEDLLSTEGPFAGNNVTQNAWVQAMQEAVEQSNGQREMFEDETALGRLAMIKSIPGAENALASRIGLRVTDVTHIPREDADALARAVPQQMGDIPPQLATYYSFNVPIEINDEMHTQRINLINGAAVERMQGPPRPTTISVTQEWLNQLEPIEQGDRRRVLYLTGNPHILRTAADTSQLAIRVGHDEIDWEIAGTDHNPGKAIQTALGEVARLVDNDVRKNYPSEE